MWISEAARIEDAAAPKALLSLSFKGKIQITRTVMVNTLYSGTTEHIIAIQSTPGMYIDKKYADTTTLIPAVRNHNVEIV